MSIFNKSMSCMHSQKKGTKAIIGAVPFQKGKLLSILGTNMC